MESECIGISNHNPKTGERGAKCESKVKVKGCKAPDNGLCWMHCDCSYCGTKHYTKNQGIIHPDVKKYENEFMEMQKGWTKVHHEELAILIDLRLPDFYRKCIATINNRMKHETRSKISALKEEIKRLQATL